LGRLLLLSGDYRRRLSNSKQWRSGPEGRRARLAQIDTHFRHFYTPRLTLGITFFPLRKASLSMPATLTRPKSKSKTRTIKKAPGAAAASNARPAKGAKNVKRVYFFGNGKAEGGADMKDLLGGKGANLADMTKVPLPVPPGFTITTETCGEYNDAGQKLPRGLMEEVRANIAKVEKATGKKLGDPNNPLLV